VKEKEVPFYQLNERQKKVLFLIMEYGAVGPSQVAKELLISLSTAYRDLRFLESLSLLQPDKQGKRCLTSTCIERLDELINL
jgi:DeoR/GlpR family transcriptional regulator of sugar metabolism